MAVTELTLSTALALVGLLLSLFVGTLGGKNDRMIIPSIAIFGVVVPLIFSFLYGLWSPFIIIFDWPTVLLVPQMTIFAGTIVGGFLGLKAGMIWYDDNDRSCLQCQLVPITLLVLASLIILLLP